MSEIHNSKIKRCGEPAGLTRGCARFHLNPHTQTRRVRHPARKDQRRKIKRKKNTGLKTGHYRAEKLKADLRTCGLADSLVFIVVLAGNIVLGNFVGANFASVGVSGVLHPFHYLGFEGVSFFEQFVHTLGICAFGVG